jgi:ERF superfamily
MMHRSSDTIGAIAAALAKAQGEFANPEKALRAAVLSPFPQGADRTFRYASLASGLDIIRKTLGHHEIATIQTTAIDQVTGQIQLTTLLAHASGEWIASDWPVCSISEASNPYHVGAALSYARRYALFALVGIAGEDNLDTPELVVDPSSAMRLSVAAMGQVPASQSPTNGSLQDSQPSKSRLDPEPSAILREALITEIQGLKGDDDLAQWASRRLSVRNILTAEDAVVVEEAYQAGLDAIVKPTGENGDAASALPPAVGQVVSPIRKEVRQRNKAHLAFVAAQPCLVCRRSPCDAHHLKFAQPRSLGRKVSDEFTVPLCRYHHEQLHRKGSELAWWADLQIAPLEVARDLWQATLLGRDPSAAHRLLDWSDSEQGAERSQRDETSETSRLGSKNS